ncbi:MAG: hypothetical protein HQ580_05725 [Planctomycetes bacterium]|nr:hypothetical protein [Planctomycetota bacterium]
MLNRPIPKNAKIGIGGFTVLLILGFILLPMAGGSRANANDVGKMPHPSVRLVVGPDTMTFEGQQVTWEQLPALLEKVTKPGNTIFEIAVSTKEMPLSRYDSAMSRASKLVKQFGFEYLSYVGQHKLDSKAARKVSGVDITPADFDIRLDEKRGVCNLVVSIQNECALAIPKFKLNFYRGDPGDNLNEAGNVHRGWHEAGPIEPGKRWNERTGYFHLPDGKYDFNVFLDYDNRISEFDENNNRALLQVRIENGRIADKSVTCPTSPKGLKTDVQVEIKGIPAGSKVPAEMVGTWFFDNPHGDEEQMAIFPDGRVVVLYSNGHKDKTNIVNDVIELAEYKNAKCRMAVRQDGTLVQYFGQSESNGKRWRRIAPEPHTNLLGALSDSWRFKGKYSVKLPDDVKVELVGVCDWPKEGKRCWQPDGSQLPMEIYATKWNQEPEAGQYGFMYKVTGPDDLKLSCSIFGASSTEGSCKVMDAFGRKFKDLTASISDMEEGRLSTTIRIGVAAGTWETIASHDGKRMTIGRQGGILWSQAFQSDSGTHIVTSREWRKDQTDRVVAIDKDGKLHTTGGGSVASGKIDQHTASFRNLKLGQIKEFQYQTRPYQWIEFKNVSLSATPSLLTRVYTLSH